MTDPLQSPTLRDWPSRLRQWVRVMGVLLRFGLRADPALVLAYFFVVSIWQVVILARIYATKLIVDAALAADLNGATIGALIYGGGSLILMQCTKSQLWVIFRLEEKTSQVVDRELMEVIGGLPGLQHHEDPRYLNEFNLLRSQRSRRSTRSCCCSRSLARARSGPVAQRTVGKSKRRKPPPSAVACAVTSSASPQPPPPVRSCVSSTPRKPLSAAMQP
jgi:hypothetical protein